MSLDELNRRRDDELQRTLGRLESKVDTLVDAVVAGREADVEIEARVRSLEVSRGWFIGAGAGAGGLLGWLSSLFR